MIIDATQSTSSSRGPEPVSENICAEKTIHQMQLNAKRCRRYHHKCKQGDIMRNSKIIQIGLKISLWMNHSCKLLKIQMRTQTPALSRTYTVIGIGKDSRNARKTREEGGPPSVYTLYISHNGAHNLFQNLFEMNPLVAEKIWNFAMYKGFNYPLRPNLPELDLVSERLISRRLPLLQIQRLRCFQGQYGPTEQVNNVPVNANIR